MADHDNVANVTAAGIPEPEVTSIGLTFPARNPEAIQEAWIADRVLAQNNGVARDLATETPNFMTEPLQDHGLAIGHEITVVHDYLLALDHHAPVVQVGASRASECRVANGAVPCRPHQNMRSGTSKHATINVDAATANPNTTAA